MHVQRLRLGTRGSMLAVAQSRAVARQLGRLHPGLAIDIVTLDTAGDRDRTTPLTQVSDPAFFSDALEAALRAGDIDLVVHSRKDLPDRMPRDLELTAIPKRANPRDVVVFRGDVLNRIGEGRTLRIGTSSQRREHFVQQFLQENLPNLGGATQLQMHPLRGPVDQRLKRLRDNDPAELDGVVLALAGLERLWADAQGQRALARDLEKKRWMVLPLTACPAAPGQGALAIQTRTSDSATQRLVASLHDETTARLVTQEYQAVGELPADHQASAAATAIAAIDMNPLIFIRSLGDTHGGQVCWPEPPKPDRASPWDSATWMSDQPVEPIAFATLPDGPVFLAHARAVHDALPALDNRRIWVSGLPTWRRLAAKGIWVEGCAESLGFEHIVPTLTTPVLGLPPLEDWLVLTRAGAESTWNKSGVSQVFGTYRMHTPRLDAAARDAVAEATHYYWSSARQYAALSETADSNAHHACGPGKTAAALRARGLSPDVFPNRQAWQRWLA